MKTNGAPKIDKGIPVPPRAAGKGLTALLRSMEPGDSVLLKVKKMTSIGSLCTHTFGPGNYTSRTVDGGVRVWRLK